MPSIIHKTRARRRPQRRFAGGCTVLVNVLRPVAPRFPAFLNHPDAPPRGFIGFSMRAAQIEI